MTTGHWHTQSVATNRGSLYQRYSNGTPATVYKTHRGLQLSKELFRRSSENLTHLVPLVYVCRHLIQEQLIV